MPNKVKCSVSNCNYWENEDCKATAIEVNVDGGGAMSKSEADTKCHTFAPKI